MIWGRLFYVFPSVCLSVFQSKIINLNCSFWSVQGIVFILDIQISWVKQFRWHNHVSPCDLADFYNVTLDDLSSHMVLHKYILLYVIWVR